MKYIFLILWSFELLFLRYVNLAQSTLILLFTEGNGCTFFSLFCLKVRWWLEISKLSPKTHYKTTLFWLITVFIVFMRYLALDQDNTFNKKRVRNLLLQQHFHQFLRLFCFLLLLPNIWWKLMLQQSLMFAYIQLHSVSDYKKRLYKKRLVDHALIKKRTLV